ncbi:MAG: hypothetical protein H6709_10500 [Kofleriaceae bacterium]|nr:hypothetical protein [Kofleriaceae bacterium]MCB9572505.1 hypothetical protein [Kofleriaceae bacterium]
MHNERSGYSVVAPRGWQAHEAFGSTIYVDPNDQHRSVAIRSVAIRGDVKAGGALTSTGAAISALPEVELQGQESITEPMPGALYSLTFAPPGSATRYRRLHVVLQGESHVFHIIETVPAADELDIETLTGIVAGFREEV